MGNAGTAIKNFFINVGKAIAKGLTKVVLGKLATRMTGTPVLGNSLADAINSLYAMGIEDLGKGSKDFDVNKINKQIMDAFPEQDKFQAINSKADFLALVKDFPKEAKKAGIKEADLPTASASAPTMAVMAKGGVVKPAVKPAVKKARSPAQIAATKRMLTALAKYKASKK